MMYTLLLFTGCFLAMTRGQTGGQSMEPSLPSPIILTTTTPPVPTHGWFDTTAEPTAPTHGWFDTTASPSVEPTTAPTGEPSGEPSKSPTAKPTPMPTEVEPTPAPFTPKPTPSPTEVEPTPAPLPAVETTVAPTSAPTPSPITATAVVGTTASPTGVPTMNPTAGNYTTWNRTECMLISSHTSKCETTCGKNSCWKTQRDYTGLAPEFYGTGISLSTTDQPCDDSKHARNLYQNYTCDVNCGQQVFKFTDSSYANRFVPGTTWFILVVMVVYKVLM